MWLGIIWLVLAAALMALGPLHWSFSIAALTWLVVPPAAVLFTAYRPREDEVEAAVRAAQAQLQAEGTLSGDE